MRLCGEAHVPMLVTTRSQRWTPGHRPTSVWLLPVLAVALAIAPLGAGGQELPRVTLPGAQVGDGGGGGLAGMTSLQPGIQRIERDGARLTTTDVDAEFDPGQKRKRMGSCVRAAQAWVEANPRDADLQVQKLMTQAQMAAPGQQDVSAELTAEQGTNQLVFGMIMACYHSIDKETVEQVHDGRKLVKAEEEKIFELSETPPRPSRKQYILLESVMKEEQIRMSQDMQVDPRDIGIVGRKLPGQAQAVYLLLVVALFGGLAAYAFPKVLRPAREVERNTKMARKLAKAEKMLDKKKLG